MLLRQGSRILSRAAQGWNLQSIVSAQLLDCNQPGCIAMHSMWHRPYARPAEMDEDNVVETSDRVKQLAEDIMHLNLLEVADLTDILQKRLGISGGFAAMPNMMPMQGAPAAESAEAAPAPKIEEKTEFDVKLEGFDAASKIKVIKEIRAITELGLKEAKELVEKSPVVVKTGLKKEEGEELKKRLETVGGKVLLE